MLLVISQASLWMKLMTYKEDWELGKMIAEHNQWQDWEMQWDESGVILYARCDW